MKKTHVSAVSTVLAVLLVHAAPAASPDLEGEILVGELNCIACHDATPVARERLMPRAAPKLGYSGLRMTPQWLRAFLDNPKKLQPSTMMPDMLGDLAGSRREETVDALVQYLVSLRKGLPAVTEFDESVIAKGRTLYHTVGCVACHAPMDPPPGSAADNQVLAEMAKATADSVRLGDLARKFTVPDLAEFLENPLKSHPSGRMPSSCLKSSEARAIAMYLLREQVPANGEKGRGLKYDYYEKMLQSVKQIDAETPDESGFISGVSTRPAKRDEYVSLRFRGGLIAPTSGVYTFYTRSDDGSWLYIDGKLVVNNGGDHAAEEKSGQVKLSAGEHAFACYFYQGSSEYDLTASWEGPGIPKNEIPDEAFTRGEPEMTPLGAENFKPDEEKIAKGRGLFESLNCVICHRVVGRAGVMSLKALDRLDPARPDGCLGAEPAPGLPRYQLAGGQRDAIAKTLANAAALNQPPPPAQQIGRAMTALNCVACHARAGAGGPQGFRRQYFTATGGGAADEDRFPPALDGIGARHDAAWMVEAFRRKDPVRGKMSTRMPDFGEAVGGLPELFLKADAPAGR